MSAIERHYAAAGAAIDHTSLPPPATFLRHWLIDIYLAETIAGWLTADSHAIASHIRCHIGQAR